MTESLPPTTDTTATSLPASELDTRLHESEIRLNNSEAALNRANRLVRRKELRRAHWDPLVVAILAAAVAALGNAAVTLVSSNGELRLENRKSENARILEVIKTGDPDKAATNLDFLLQTNLIADPFTREKLKSYLDNRKTGTGVVLPADGRRACERIASLTQLGWSSGHKTQFCIAHGFDGVFNPFGEYKAGGYCFKGDTELCIAKIQAAEEHGK